MKQLFEAEDFYGCHDESRIIADVANEKFNEWLEKQPVVFGTKDGTYGWAFEQNIAHVNECTHKARLVMIEETKQ